MSSQQVTPQTRWGNTGKCKEQSLDSFVKMIKSLTTNPVTVRQMAEDTGLCTKTIYRYIKILSLHFPLAEYGQRGSKYDPPRYYIKTLFPS